MMIAHIVAAAVEFKLHDVNPRWCWWCSKLLDN